MTDYEPWEKESVSLRHENKVALSECEITEAGGKLPKTKEQYDFLLKCFAEHFEKQKRLK